MNCDHLSAVVLLAVVLLEFSPYNLALPLTPRTDNHVAKRDAGLKEDTEKDSPKNEKKDDDEDPWQFVLFEGDIILSLQEMAELKISRAENPFDEPTSELGEDSFDSTEDDNGARSKRRIGSGMQPPLTKADSKVINRSWLNCEVPYKFDQLLGHNFRAVFMDAMNMWEEDTCIRFIPAQRHHLDYLLLLESDKCSSHVGRTGAGAQQVTIAEACGEVGHAAHELGHAIGLWHEHSRLDRDKYITIHWENIERTSLHNFEKISRNELDEVPDIGYDIQSIMHYSQFAFAKRGMPVLKTITLKENITIPELECLNTLTMGQREELSYKDKKRVNELYDCDVELEEPICITPTTTTPETTTEAITMPTPTTTAAATKAATIKLNSGMVIALTFGTGNESHGMKCVPSPGCTPLPCRNYGGNTCESVENQFQLINQNSARRVRSGNTVLLRSVNTPTSWLDCSNPTRCVISPCTEDNHDDPANSSYISNCSRHFFQVHGVHGKKFTRLDKNKLLNTAHTLQFKQESDYLSCNGKRCGLIHEGACPNNRFVKVVRQLNGNTGQCPIEDFTPIVLSDF